MSLGRTFNYTRKKLYAEKVKGTVKGEASDPLLIEWQFRFTTVPLKALSGVSNHYISLFHAGLENCLFLDVASLQKLLQTQWRNNQKNDASCESGIPLFKCKNGESLQIITTTFFSKM